MPTNNTRQAAWVAIGSLFSFAVGIVSPMILSRFFDKGDYGTYRQVMFVYTTLLTVFSLGLPKAYSYFLPKYSREYSKDIINKITSLFIVLGAVFSVFLFSCSGLISRILNNDDLALALRVFAPTPFFLFPTIGLEGIYSSFRKTQFLTIYTVATRVLTVACTLLPVVIMKGNFIHALIGFDVASLITCFIALLMKSLPVKNEAHKQSTLTIRQILQFSIPLLFASIWGIVHSSANQFFISRYFGNEVFAEFSNGFMEIPFASMVIGAVTTVLLPRFSEMADGSRMNDEVYSLWQSALEKSAKIIFPILVFSTAFAKLIMVCMYGDAYGASSVYFMIKNISSMLYIVPFAPIILAIGKTKEYANAHMVAAFLVVVLEFISVKTISSSIVIAIISEICQTLKIYLMLRVISHCAGRTILELIPLKSLGIVLFISCLAAGATFFVSLLFAVNKWALALICVSIFCLFYYALCWLSKTTYRTIVIGFVPSLKNKSLLKFIP